MREVAFCPSKRTPGVMSGGGGSVRGGVLHSVGKSACRSVSQSVRRWTVPSIDRSVARTVGRSVDRSFGRFAGRSLSACRTVCRRVERSSRCTWPISRSIGRSFSPSVGLSTGSHTMPLFYRPSLHRLYFCNRTFVSGPRFDVRKSTAV